MKIKKEFIELIFLFSAAILLIAFSSSAKSGAFNGLEMAGRIVIPSLLPLLIIINLISNAETKNIIEKYTNNSPNLFTSLAYIKEFAAENNGGLFVVNAEGSAPLISMRYKDFINNNTNNDEYSQYIDYIDAYLHETINILADKKAFIILQGLEGEKYKDKLSVSKDRASVMIVWVSDKLNKEQCSSLSDKAYTLISAKYQQGIDVLLQKISARIAEEFTASSGALITRRRYREVLSDVFKDLQRFNLHKSIELAAEDIRLAARNIGKITGRIEVDEILDKIFGSFCIGK